METPRPPLPSVCRIRACFRRGQQAARFSQLEQIRVLRKIAQDSGLPLVGGGKRSPVKMSFGPAITVGYLSESEYADIYLTEAVAVSSVREQLERVACGGFSLVDARRIPLNFPSVEALVGVAEYEIDGDFSDASLTPVSFLSARELIVEKAKPSGAREIIDAKPLIKSMRLEDGKLRLVLRFGPKKNLKPERILEMWLGRRVCPEGSGFSIIRKQLYWEDAQGNLNAP